MNNDILQTAFDKICAQAAKGEKSGICHEGIFYCKYRSASGEKCFVGAIFPDSEYHPSFESSTVRQLMYRHDCPRCLLELPLEFLASAQKIHDTTDVGDWITNLQTLAYKFYLVFPKHLFLTRSETPR